VRVSVRGHAFARARRAALIVAGVLVAGTTTGLATGSAHSSRAAAPACPRALPPGPRDAERAAAAVTDHLASALKGLDVHGARVMGAPAP